MPRWMYVGAQKQVRLPDGRTVLGRHGMVVTAHQAPEGLWQRTPEPAPQEKQQRQAEDRMMHGPEEDKGDGQLEEPTVGHAPSKRRRHTR